MELIRAGMIAMILISETFPPKKLTRLGRRALWLVLSDVGKLEVPVSRRCGQKKGQVSGLLSGYHSHMGAKPIGA